MQISSLIIPSLLINPYQPTQKTTTTSSPFSHASSFLKFLTLFNLFPFNSRKKLIILLIIIIIIICLCMFLELSKLEDHLQLQYYSRSRIMEIGRHEIGTRFEPSPRECIAYLLHKVSGERLASHFFISNIPTIDIYGDQVDHPSLIFPASDHQENYFYSSLKKAANININDPNQIYSRVSGNGVWAECGMDSVLDSKGGVILGFLNFFKYEGRTTDSDDAANNNHHEWFLKEYSLSYDLKHCSLEFKYIDYVFCIVKRNPNVQVDPEKHSDWFLDNFFDEMFKLLQRPMLLKGSSSSSSSSSVDPCRVNSTVAEGADK